jgi:hypothetical protein
LRLVSVLQEQRTSDDDGEQHDDGNPSDDHPATTAASARGCDRLCALPGALVFSLFGPAHNLFLPAYLAG